MILKNPKFLHLAILNILAITFYFLIFSQLKTGIEKDIMFSTPDSQTFLGVSDWLENGTDSESVSIRPILFPLLLLISSKIGGIIGIWLMHFLFWLTTINLVFISIKKLTENYFSAYLGSFILMINISLITLTLHGLTEVTTAFVLSLLVYFITKNKENFKNLKFIHRIILYLVLLTIIKPVFYYPLLFTVIIALPLFYFKKYKEKPIKLIYLLLILAPLFLQLGIMKNKYDVYKVSNIDKITFTNYLIAQGIEKHEHISLDEAILKANKLSSSEKNEYLMSNISLYSKVFIKNIEDNVCAHSTFLIYPPGYENLQMAKFMKTTNKIYFLIHLLFIPLMLILFILFIRFKDFNNLIILLILSAITYYYIVSTGISAYQGDRLVISVIVVWIPLYAFTIQHLIRLGISKNRSNRMNS